MSRLIQAASVLTLGYNAFAQSTNTPFLVTGSLDGCSVNNATEYNSGGVIRVNNFQILVPKNLLVALPTVFLPFSELCSAKAERFETNVVGNIIDGKIIAGQVSIAQRFALELSQGHIESVNADGTLKIANGPIVRLNDPKGRFGPKFDESEKYWQVDSESPSVTAFSGFPMCIPYAGNADTCLILNRGSGSAFRPQDPLRMVPLAAGDFVEYSGLTVGENEILASEITCISLHITTAASDTEPNYIRIEEFLIGVPDTAPNVEVADIRVVGYLSSCSGATVAISAVDVDPCTGEETYREIANGTPRQQLRCRFDIRFTSPGRGPFTREYRITTNTPVIETKDGLKASQYKTPVTEWIFPEVDTPGTFPPPFPFTEIRGLVEGDYLDGKQFGPLDPFPGANPPAPSKTCSSEIPNPDPDLDNGLIPAAIIQTISTTQRSGVDIELAGSSNNSAIPNANLSFKWTQVSPASPLVILANNQTSKASFNAPKVSDEIPFVFKLDVCSMFNLTRCSNATASVRISPSVADTVKIDTYTWVSRQSGTIDVACSSNVKNGDNKAMKLVINGNTQIQMTQSASAGKWTYNARSTARPTNLKCVSDLLGESPLKLGTETTTKRRRSDKSGRMQKGLQSVVSFRI